MKLNGKTKAILIFCGAVVLAIIAAGFLLPATQGGGSGDSDNGTGKGATEPAPQTELTAEQQAAIDAYDTEKEDLLARLETGVWVDSRETTTLTFDSDTVTIASEKEEDTYSFAILVMDEAPLNAYDSLEEAITMTTAALSTDDGYAMLTMTRQPGSRASLQCPLFGDGYFVQHTEGDEIEVEDMDKSIVGLAGQDAVDDLTDDIIRRAFDYYPTATQATWSKQAEIDWEAGKITTSYIFDNRANTKYNVTLDIL